MSSKELRILFPGEKREFEKFDVVVYPIGFGQIRAFSETLISSLRIIFEKIDLDEAKLEDDKAMKDLGIKLISLLSPIATRDLLGIFKDCLIVKTKPSKEYPEGIEVENSVDHIPHWNIAPLISDWLKVSFLGEEKIRPWIEAMREVGKEISNMNFHISSE